MAFGPATPVAPVAPIVPIPVAPVAPIEPVGPAIRRFHKKKSKLEKCVFTSSSALSERSRTTRTGCTFFCFIIGINELQTKDCFITCASASPDTCRSGSTFLRCPKTTRFRTRSNTSPTNRRRHVISLYDNLYSD